jgi:malonate-semialdehyde dehydrogenase (acetylating)/methylmalonate-semialdehyde dehydrogenase
MIGHFISGNIRNTQGPRKLPVYNPTTGEQTKEVAMATAEETREAIASAHAAWLQWKDVTPLKRARVLFKFKTLLEDSLEDLAALVTGEHGKILSDARGEIIRGLEVVEFACGIPHLLKGDYSSNVGHRIDSWSMQQPLGVCAGITPFNFPVMVPLWMIPLALACGNTFVLKPSEKVPSSTLRLAELLQRAGLPDGALNIINGDKEAVDVLLTDPRVQAVSFVGSTRVAESIYTTASAAGKRVQALGGAKNHLVVMPDANLHETAKALMGAAYGSAGERCMAISVAVCIGDTADRLLDQLRPMIASLRVGPGLGCQPENEMGPLISREHLQKVHYYIEQGIGEGAQLVIDGRRLEAANGASGGFFIGATLFDQVTPEMTLYQEEIFGPVLAIVRVKDAREALALINAHEFGNGAAIFTQNGHMAREFAENVAVGMVGINVPIPVPMAFHCFGGWKRSLFGSAHMHGTDGVRFYTRVKTVTAHWLDGHGNTSPFNLPTL